MCGIVGLFLFSHKACDPSIVHNMNNALSHRGPDHAGVYCDGSLGLGHRRLSILDLSDRGNQPMVSPCGRYTLVFNGEIYNFHDLKKDLEQKKYRFSSATDTEVLLYSLIEWGPTVLSRLNGMFSFAFWDKEKRTILLGRDRYGIKPLYYFLSNDHLIFASEIKGILASGLYKKILDKEAVIEYFTFQNLFTQKTLFKDIHMFEAGHYGIVSQDGHFEKYCYWDFHFESEHEFSEKKTKEHFFNLLTQAVKRQLMSDVPVNAYLSGGLDSGAITLIASQNLPSLKTFTIGFDLSSSSGLELSFDERRQAERLSYLAKSEHYEMVLKAGDMEKSLPFVVNSIEEPRVGQSYPNYYAAKLASKFGKVVLSGAGGDELLGGYPWRYFFPQESIEFQDFIKNYYKKWHRLLPNACLKELLKPIGQSVEDVSTITIFEKVFKKYQHQKKNK